MNESQKLQLALKKCAEIIGNSKNPEDLSHAENTREWIVKLQPDADEILQLAGYAHDIQRGLLDRLQKTDYPTYDEYQWAHAAKSAEITKEIALDCGFSQEEADRLEHIIANGEFHSDDVDVQLLRDANSISIFDNNTAFYLENKGLEWTKEKMQQNYDFASELAKRHIKQVLTGHGQKDLIELN